MEIGAWTTSYQENVWNNITITNGQPVLGYDVDEPFSTGSSTSPLSYMDYNVYDSTPEYDFNGTIYTLAQMQAQGFEQHAYVVSSAIERVPEFDLLRAPTAVDDGWKIRRPCGPPIPGRSDHEYESIRAWCADHRNQSERHPAAPESNGGIGGFGNL